MKKIIIIGGGIAGLSAGVYAQKNGFEAEIYEKHSITGGQCTGWNRNGYHIDNCIHWLTGTNENASLRKIWEEIGALPRGIEIINAESFYSVEIDGECITLWQDLERTRAEMLALSPTDSDEINKFIDYTKLTEKMEMPIEKPMDMLSPIEMIKLGTSMASMGKIMKEYGKINIEDLSNKFHHPLLKKLITEYMGHEYLAYALLISYATFTAKSGGFPRGGSLAMAQRMQKHFEDLGGKVYTNSDVTKVLITDKNATGILLANGKTVAADYVICACDMNYTFSTLLDKKYMNNKIKDAYDNYDANPVTSGFQVAFSVDSPFEIPCHTTLFNCDSIKIATQTTTIMSVKTYPYEPSFAPEGKSIVQSNFLQYGKDYDYWIELYKNKEAYNNEKMRLANEILVRLETKYPAYTGKFNILDVWTPATYNRYCNAYKGAYMSFIMTKDSKSTNFSGEIKGLNNVFLASQWLMGPGGLPTAAIMGKFAIQRIMK